MASRATICFAKVRARWCFASLCGNVKPVSYTHLKLVKVLEDSQRPQLLMEVIHEVQHQPFKGFNRAQAAVIELAVLVSRLERLSKDKVLSEMAYLQIAIDKTAGERELQAWGWLVEKVENFYAAQSGENFA